MDSSGERLEFVAVTDVITLPNCRRYILAHRKNKRLIGGCKEFLLGFLLTHAAKSDISFSPVQSMAPVTLAAVHYRWSK